ncbi:MAG: BamA/TamA family outer membrane protein [Ginsengibacter sp.]
MRKGFGILLLLFISKICISQSDSVQARIVLIGDAGELNYGREPVVDAVKDLIPMDEKTTVIYLGDNLYNYGLPDEIMPEYQNLKSILDSQINISKGTKAKVLFIPGNHDWSNEAANGLEIVKRQGDYVNAHNADNVFFIPTGGCPGPIEYTVNDNVVVIAYDSQWFIRKPGTKPGIESDCANKTETQFYTELGDMLNRNSDKLVILVQHHTLKSYGIHGGYFKWKQAIFPLTDVSPKLYIPLPVIGFIYPIVRKTFGTPEDLHYPAYENMIKNVQKEAKKFPNVIFAAGHEHTLQLIKDSSYYYIVSGAGSKHTRVSHGKGTLFDTSSLGFAVLEISKNKNVRADFYSVNEDTVTHPFSKTILNFSSITKDSSAPDVTKIPESVPIRHFEDSVTVAIDTSFQKASGLQKFVGGTNYRREWGTPVHLKVFDINKENGGYSIKNLGGGKQTKSLKLLDKDGNGWTLRTVNKDPSGVIAEQLRTSVPKKMLTDLISAEHPYGALIVPTLAKAAGIDHAVPKYYFVPDDPAFGLYREVFANKVCLLEVQNPIKDRDNGTKSTSTIIDRLTDDSKYHVDQQAVLNARLLDIVIGDWDRHFDQWKWGTADTGVGKLYYPVPRDRDEAFFNSDGFFVQAASIAALPYLQGFKKHYTNIKWFNWEQRYFDRFFLTGLDKETWRKTIKDFQSNVSDTVINEAVKNLPPEIYKIEKQTIASKLKSRRDHILRAGLKYYDFISKEVNIVGSNKREYFKVFNSGDKLEVKVYKRNKESDSSSVMFDRTFDRAATKYVNLFGLSGDDMFEIDSTADSRIRLRIIGGRDNDTFKISGNVRNTVYDFLPEKNYIASKSRTKNQISSDVQVNNYDPTGFNYDSYRLPLLSVGFNEEDKLIAGIGYSLKTYRFRKDPYSTFQKITSLFDFKSSAYQVNYDGEFNQRLGKYDLVANAKLFNTVLDNFYGIGNETKKDKSKGVTFNNVRYNFMSADLLIRKRLHNLLEFNIGPTIYHYWNHYYDNADKILSHPGSVGLDSSNIYASKTYVGAKAQLKVHNLNDDLMPTRGVSWNTEISSMYGVNDMSHHISKLTTDMVVYASLNDPTNLVGVIRLGYGHIINTKYEYFQALTLGSNNYLRGFTKDRFAGRSLMYFSLEGRLKLFDSKSYLFPGPVGIIGFNDIGRVWSKRTETSHKWHDAFGGGLYYSPYKFAIISATIAFSGEGSLYNFSMGTKFNLTY